MVTLFIAALLFITQLPIDPFTPSKKTLSPAVGMLADPVPPEVLDQLAVLFQLAVVVAIQ